MGWTFRMVFEGVCAFVPDTPLYEKKGSTFEPAPQPPKKMTVLLPDLRQAKRATATVDAVRPAHFPLMLLRLDDWREGSDRFLDLQVRVPDEGIDKGVFVLQGDSINLEKPAESRERKLAFRVKQGIGKVPEAHEQDSLWWVPRFDEITESSGQFPARLEPRAGDPLAEELAGAITLEFGQVTTAGFNLPGEGATRPTVWTFRPPGETTGGRWNRAVGNRIVVEVNDLTAPIRLRFLQVVEGHHITSYATFAPPPGSRREAVEVLVANVELEKLFEHHSLFGAPPPSAQDPDFEAFYDLVKELNPANRFVPSLSSAMTAFGPTTKPCAPTFATGFQKGS